VPKCTKVAPHVCNGAPQGGPARRYKKGNNTVEGRGNKAAEDDNEGRN
jgi:hypothetical protein